jgi:hypothetical protein
MGGGISFLGDPSLSLCLVTRPPAADSERGLRTIVLAPLSELQREHPQCWQDDITFVALRSFTTRAELTAVATRFIEFHGIADKRRGIAVRALQRRRSNADASTIWYEETLISLARAAQCWAHFVAEPRHMVQKFRDQLRFNFLSALDPMQRLNAFATQVIEFQSMSPNLVAQLHNDLTAQFDAIITELEQRLLQHNTQRRREWLDRACREVDWQSASEELFCTYLRGAGIAGATARGWLFAFR